LEGGGVEDHVGLEIVDDLRQLIDLEGIGSPKPDLAFRTPLGCAQKSAVDPPQAHLFVTVAGQHLHVLAEPRAPQQNFQSPPRQIPGTEHHQLLFHRSPQAPFLTLALPPLVSRAPSAADCSSAQRRPMRPLPSSTPGWNWMSASRRAFSTSSPARPRIWDARRGSILWSRNAAAAAARRPWAMATPTPSTPVTLPATNSP